MIDLTYIRNFFPEPIRSKGIFDKYMLKEYLQLMILDYISASGYAGHLSFIGGTNLRLIMGLDRFSEDLDFDCKDLTAEGFRQMTDDVLAFLQQNGLNVEPRDKDNPRLTAYRRNIYFPELLFDLNISGHKDERFLIKIEAQDQEVDYKSEVAKVSRCGFFFPIQVPPKAVLCSMKLAALLSRSKGRDFYDTMFLLSQTEPDYSFLQKRNGIDSLPSLKKAVTQMLRNVELDKKARDFRHLLFNPDNSGRILRFRDFINNL